jgi:protocatechuate 3,4-dioxygenase beta subunit
VLARSIFPACYAGRWPHIHFEVYPNQADLTDAANAVTTSQVALPKNICTAVYAASGYEASVKNLARVSLDSDNVFGDDSAALQLATVTGDPDSGYAASLLVRVDTTTTPTGGMGGPPPSGRPGGAPPSR